MKNFLFGSGTALLLLALPAMANPIIKVNDVAGSSFHPAKMQLALPGIGHGLGKGKQHFDMGMGELISETGSAREDFSAPVSPSDSNLPTVPEPSTLALFGIFFMALFLRSRWATWHR